MLESKNRRYLEVISGTDPKISARPTSSDIKEASKLAKQSQSKDAPAISYEDINDLINFTEQELEQKKQENELLKQEIVSLE